MKFLLRRHGCRMATTKAMAPLLAIVLSLLFSSALLAEIHPKYYVKMQHEAAEFIKIKVLEVTTSASDKPHTVMVNLKVEIIEVIRSKTNLSPKTTIYIEYPSFSPPPGWAGPRPIPVLEKNKIYDFFGHKLETTKEGKMIFAPSARGYSFESILDK